LVYDDDDEINHYLFHLQPHDLTKKQINRYIKHIDFHSNQRINESLFAIEQQLPISLQYC